MFNDGGIKAEAVQSILDYLYGVHDQVKRGKYSAHNAVSFTCEIENLIIEKDFFNRFRVSEQYGDMLQMLIRDTKAHALLARRTLDALEKK